MDTTPPPSGTQTDARHEQLPDDVDAANLTHDPVARRAAPEPDDLPLPGTAPAPRRNPADGVAAEDRDEPVVYGPDGSGEAVDHESQPYSGAD